MDNKFLYKFDINQHPSGTWLYAFGSLAGRENNFFDEAQLQQLFRVNSIEALLNLMRDANYPGDSVNEALLDSEEEDLILLKSIMPNYKLIEIFLLPKDSHNLKVLLRSYFSSSEKPLLKNIQHLFSGPYLTEPKDILNSIRQDNEAKSSIELQESYSNDLPRIPNWMLEIIKLAKKEYTETYNMARVDQIVEQITWKQLILLLEDLKSPWLYDFFLLKADLKNLEILFRCQSLNLDKTFFEFSILEQGTLRKEEWLTIFEMNEQELIKELSENDLDEFSEFIENYHALGQASAFTQIADRKLMFKLRESKTFVAQQEKIAAYFLLRDMERKNIRIAKACFDNNFSPERASQLIRPSYKGG